MPYEIFFENVPAGVAAEAVRTGPAGGTGKVITREFISEEDGNTLVERLEGFGSAILDKLPVPTPIRPNQVEHLLAVIKKDGNATVYVNELKPIGTVQAKKQISPGDAVYSDDIAEIVTLEMEGVVLPKDVGIIYIFSVGWRRAMFYDLAPINATYGTDREYDIAIAFAQMYSYLLFQSRFAMSDAVWEYFLQSQWFPFISLRESTVRSLIAHAKEKWSLDDLTDSIAAEVKILAPKMVDRWKQGPAFAEHSQFLETAVERYLANDFVSSTAILYPRIEGLLRSTQKLTDPTGNPTQKGLSGSAVKVAEVDRHGATPLLPARFRRYLEEVYFAAFNPADPKIKVSRNSVGHGVVHSDECNLKSATISLLLVDQLFYLTSKPTATVENPTP
jgi:hypothetical protein